MQKILSLLKKTDVYGSQYKTLIDNSTSVKSIAGGLMSLATFMFFIFVFIIFGQDFYHKKNPKVLIQQKVLNDYELYALNNYTIQNKSIVITVRKELNDVTDWIVYANAPYSFQEDKIYEFLRPCNDSFVIRNFYNGNATYAMDELTNKLAYYCHDLSKFKFGLPEAGGGAGSNLVNPLSMWTIPCEKKTKGLVGKKCPKGYNSSSFTSRTAVEIWSYETLFDPDSFEQPFSESLKRIGNLRPTKNSKSELFLSMKIHENHDNKGFFMDTDVVTKTVGVDSYEQNIIFLDIPKDYYDVSVYIGFSKNYSRYTRTYMKIQDLLAQVGGVIKAVFTFFQIFSYFFNSYYLNLYVLSLTERERIDTIGKGESQTPQITKKKNKIEVDSIIQKPPDVSNSKIGIKDNDLKDSKINNFIAKMNSNQNSALSTNLTMYDYLKYLLSYSTEDVKRSFSYVDKIRSMENLIKSNIEFIHLKKMLMNDIQNKGFQVLSFTDEDYEIDEDLCQTIVEYHHQKILSKSASDYDKYIFAHLRLTLT